MGEKPGEAGEKTPARGIPQEGARTGTGYKGSRPWGARRAFKKPVVQQLKFEGKCTELKGCIYDCTDSKQADVFTKTTKEIANYVGTNYKYGNDIKLAISTLKVPTFTEPTDPPDGASKSKIPRREPEDNVLPRVGTVHQPNSSTHRSTRRAQGDVHRRRLHWTTESHQGPGI